MEQAVCLCPVLHDIEDVTDIDIDAACEGGIIINVCRQAVPVAVEGETDEPAITIYHW